MIALVDARTTQVCADSGRGATATTLWFVVFFSNLPVYVTLFVNPSLRPLHWTSAIGGLMLVWWLQLPIWRVRASMQLPAWVAIYSVMCLVWYLAFGGGDVEVLRQRVIAAAFLLVSYLALAAGSRILSVARHAILGVVIAAVAVNFYDIANPFALVPAQSEFAVLGRATGLYGNPNQAGAALVLGLIVTISLVSSRWRGLYLSYIGIGVALTLSRSALLGFALVVLGLLFTARLTLKQTAFATLIWATLGWITAAYVLPAFAQHLNLDPQVIFERLTWIIDPVGKADFSQLERAYLADQGWEQFLNSPIVGNGIGSTELWAARSSTHNQYLLLLSDFGILGAAVIPALLVTIVIGPSARAVPERWAFVAFIALWAAVSHNVLTEYYALLAFAAMAAMCAVPGAALNQRSKVS